MKKGLPNTILLKAFQWGYYMVMFISVRIQCQWQISNGIKASQLFQITMQLESRQLNLISEGKSFAWFLLKGIDCSREFPRQKPLSTFITPPIFSERHFVCLNTHLIHLLLLEYPLITENNFWHRSLSPRLLTLSAWNLFVYLFIYPFFHYT